MSSKTGRNELCPCGSGLKHKRCCALKEAAVAAKSGAVWPLVLLVLVGGGAIFAAAVMVINGQRESLEQQNEVVRPRPSFPENTATFPTQSTPQPPGEVPEGKVWSPEHGHWHNAGAPGGPPGGLTPTLNPPRPPGQLTPQPPGEVPEGKVWSEEHGHWHPDPSSP